MSFQCLRSWLSCLMILHIFTYMQIFSFRDAKRWKMSNYTIQFKGMLPMNSLWGLGYLHRFLRNSVVELKLEARTGPMQWLCSHSGGCPGLQGGICSSPASLRAATQAECLCQARGIQPLQRVCSSLAFCLVAQARMCALTVHLQ